ncbi:HIPA PROTEIN [Mycetohabitans rhizoxinica HKI 454]|uniref:HIPA PROTEIN n=1 Tax=Mycetohabitans rhizoxinica (strain DSM 19002 / CIP 109453 / HKI 454) TaxID=882378 RepID=E5AKB4_MYCRK|nr:HIPA PROTEIN [Mycetohabitans rhizoxinica HKI 454]
MTRWWVQWAAGVDRIDGVVVDDEAIERHLLEVVTSDRFAGARDPDDDFRISLAGAQEKDAHHAHLQAAPWPGRWSAGRLQHLRGQRVAVPSLVQGVWLIHGKSSHLSRLRNWRMGGRRHADRKTRQRRHAGLRGSTCKPAGTMMRN